MLLVSQKEYPLQGWSLDKLNHCFLWRIEHTRQNLGQFSLDQYIYISISMSLSEDTGIKQSFCPNSLGRKYIISRILDTGYCGIPGRSDPVTVPGFLYFIQICLEEVSKTNSNSLYANRQWDRKCWIRGGRSRSTNLITVCKNVTIDQHPELLISFENAIPSYTPRTFYAGWHSQPAS